jgi:hypothetical protein
MIRWLLVIAMAGVLHAPASAAQPAALPTVRWDPATLRLVERGGDYPRMARLANGSLACVYDRDGKMWIRRGGDDGKSFDAPILVAEEANCWLTNAYLLALDDGRLLYFYNQRPREALRYTRKPAPGGLLTRPFLIRMAASDDHGRTWSEPRTLYAAGTSFQDGCWEPAAIQLPGGEIHVYFANESPYRSSAEQEISLIRSSDGGKTWSDAKCVAMRRGHRDGMPNPLLLADNRTLAVAIEDDGLSGGFKPAIVCSSLAENWKLPISGDSSQRWSALAEPLPADWYGGAPFLTKLPSGHVLLSYQESADGTIKNCRLAVCVGGPDAKNFTNKTYPLPKSASTNQAWNSLFVKDAATVIALSTATVDGVRGVWAIDGQVSRE